METISKILSLTLLTIFGSAAATVYMVDSNFFPSFLEDTPTTYTSDNSDFEEMDLYDDTYYRKRQRMTYMETEPDDSQPVYSSNKESVWGNKFNSTSSTSYLRSGTAYDLAQSNSLSSLKEDMKYWEIEYNKALRSKKSKSANKAYKQYQNYKQAVSIKQASTTR